MHSFQEAKHRVKKINSKRLKDMEDRVRSLLHVYVELQKEKIKRLRVRQ